LVQIFFFQNITVGLRTYSLVSYTIFLFLGHILFKNPTNGNITLTLFYYGLLVILSSYLLVKTSAVGQSSRLAMYALWFFFYAFSLILINPKKCAYQIWFISSIAMLIPYIFWGGKRNNLTMFVLGIGVFIVLNFLQNKWIRSVILICCSILTFFFQFSGTYTLDILLNLNKRYTEGITAMERYFVNEQSLGNVGWRLDSYSRAWDQALNKPLTGNGFASKMPNSFANRFLLERKQNLWNLYLHNSYLTLAACAGIISFFLLIFLTLKILAYFYTTVKDSISREYKIIATFFFCSALVFFINANFQPVFTTSPAPIGWFLIGAGYSILSSSNKNALKIFTFAREI